jgi:hypothetical protein
MLSKRVRAFVAKWHARAENFDWKNATDAEMDAVEQELLLDGLDVFDDTSKIRKTASQLLKDNKYLDPVIDMMEDITITDPVFHPMNHDPEGVPDPNFLEDLFKQYAADISSRDESKLIRMPLQEFADLLLVQLNEALAPPQIKV